MIVADRSHCAVDDAFCEPIGDGRYCTGAMPFICPEGQVRTGWTSCGFAPGGAGGGGHAGGAGGKGGAGGAGGAGDNGGAGGAGDKGGTGGTGGKGGTGGTGGKGGAGGAGGKGGAGGGEGDACAVIAGKTYASLSPGECGLSSGGQLTYCTWTISFTVDRTYYWHHSDYGLSGQYSCSGAAIVAAAQNLNGSYGFQSGLLTWAGIPYQEAISTTP